MRYISVIPAQRTIPGVEFFDYEIAEQADVQLGDVIRVPFRTQSIPALVREIMPTSKVADRAKRVEDPRPLLRLGAMAVTLLETLAARTFSSRPTVFNSWVREVPKRAVPIADSPGVRANGVRPARPTHDTETKATIHFVLDRWQDADGLLAHAKAAQGRVLIVTPWKHRADALGAELDAVVLHGDIADGAAWQTLQDFSSCTNGRLVTTRLGAWLACVADVVLLDEPENDDFKQDELAPRFDGRWIAAACQQLRPELELHAFSLTPRLQKQTNGDILTIADCVQRDPWQPKSFSDIPSLSSRTVVDIQNAVESERAIFVIHNVEGDLSKIACRDCGWCAACSFCGFSLAQSGGRGICRKCGRAADLPEMCASCGGSDLGKGRVGRDRLEKKLRETFPTAQLKVLTALEFDAQDIPRESLIVATDIGALGGGTEDIRRKERLAIAFRRVAALAARTNGSLLVQGQPDLLDECSSWLTRDGLIALWQKELEDRRLFKYPPASLLAKLLVTGEEQKASLLMRDLEKHLPSEWQVRGPFPVAYRAKTRAARSVVHVIPTEGASEKQLQIALAPFAARAIIDLDPIAFFC